VGISWEADEVGLYSMQLVIQTFNAVDSQFSSVVNIGSSSFQLESSIILILKYFSVLSVIVLP